jgi:hypothetical protein
MLDGEGNVFNFQSFPQDGQQAERGKGKRGQTVRMAASTMVP